MKNILQRQGFKLYKHNKHGVSSETVEALLYHLKLSDYSKGKDGFTYINRTDRLVFFHRQLSEDELLYVLLHEEGHIFCGHSVRNNILAFSDVLSESEANAFAFYVMQYIKTIKPRRIVLSGLLAAMSFTLLFFASYHPAVINTSTNPSDVTYDNALSLQQDISPAEKTVYVTKTGRCYHNSWCHYVEGKTNLSELSCKQCLSLGLSPCSFCKPDTI